KVSLPGKGGTASKQLVLDLDELGIPLDNVEGMTFGPRPPDGRRSVVLVSDDNFAASQFTQFLVFATDRQTSRASRSAQVSRRTTSRASPSPAKTTGMRRVPL